MTTRRSGGGIMATTSNNNNNNPEAKPVALILGGWSPGPFYYLESFLQDELGFLLLRPPMEMPPVTWGWCCHYSWQMLLLSFTFAGFLWLVRVWCKSASSCSYAAAGVVTFMGTLFWLRLVVACAVHSSMQYNIQLCRRLLVEYHVSVVVGFSWGGAVAAELLATAADPTDNALLANNHHLASSSPAYLLMAPTTAVVASLNLFQRKDAALRIGASSAAAVSVVHATADPIFCPHPERWRDQPNVEFTLLRDNHVLLRSASERSIMDILTRLLQRQRPS